MLIVLLLLTMTLALSYAAVRSQSTIVAIQRNSERGSAARQAAITGLAVAVKKMHAPNWNGLGTTLSRSLSSSESFQVAYTFGDDSLVPASPDYSELPYRITLLSTGSAADPDNPQCVAAHRIRAVVRLVPRNVPAEPNDWATMQQYTVYQTKRAPFEVDIPCRIEGRVRVQDKLKFAVRYPNDSNAWTRYLNDLNQMRLAGQPDYRPLNGPVYLATAQQEVKYILALTANLGVAVVDTPAQEAGADWVNVDSLASYQVYPNGPTYTIPAVAATLSDITLGPDPATNPLGIYFHSGSVAIRSNVTIRGSLFCDGDIEIAGTNVRFDPVDLKGLYPSQSPLRLPALTCHNITLQSTGGAALNGLLAVFGAFNVQASPDTVSFPLAGRLIAPQLTIDERQPWNQLNWKNCYNGFLLQLLGFPHVSYFPAWMATQGRDPQPRITFTPDPTAVAYHWFRGYDPVYIAHPDDGGLRWEFVSWTDSPQ